MYVDGFSGGYRSRGVTTIIQVYDADKVLVESRVLLAGETMPAWGPRPEDLVVARRRHVLFGGTTAALTLAAVSTYGASLAFRSQFNRTADEEVARLQLLRTRTNGLYWAALGTGSAALLFGTVTVVTW